MPSFRSAHLSFGLSIQLYSRTHPYASRGITAVMTGEVHLDGHEHWTKMVRWQLRPKEPLIKRGAGALAREKPALFDVLAFAKVLVQRFPT